MCTTSLQLLQRFSPELAARFPGQVPSTDQLSDLAALTSLTQFKGRFTAVVRLREGADTSPDALRAGARQHIAAYKLPRKFVFVDEILRAPSGKADYRWARDRAVADA